MMNGRNGHRGGGNYTEGGSVVGYIPDDVSSIHSSAMGGVGVPAGYPPMFQGFTPDTWPSLGPRQNGNKARGGVPGSIAGESTVPTESDVTGSGIGGVALDQLSIQDNHKMTSFNQSDRLKRYVENSAPTAGGYRAGGLNRGKGAFNDDDARSESTAFASQVGGYE